MMSRRTFARALVAIGLLVFASSPVIAIAQAPRVRVGGDVREPRKTKHVNPVYPEDAKARGIQGLVILEVVIATDGRVLDSKILRSIPALDAAAVTAVNQWEYIPTSVKGEPVEVVMTVTVNFFLREEPAK